MQQLAMEAWGIYEEGNIAKKILIAFITNGTIEIYSFNKEAIDFWIADSDGYRKKREKAKEEVFLGK